jgi:UDP-3-O-[3-hydroxymyristoyl] glucosamine N-acyltransferase
VRPLPVAVALGELVSRFGGRVRSAKVIEVLRLSSLSNAGLGDISFLSQARYLESAKQSSASIIIVTEADAKSLVDRDGLWIVDNPYLVYARLSQYFASLLDPAAPSGVHPSASIHPSAQIDPSATVGAGSFVGAHAVIGRQARLYPHTYIGENTVLGDQTVLHANVVVYQGCRIGARGIIHAGTVIGSDGFGFAKHDGQWVKIAQLGSVLIGDDVEIGSNCSIDRGAIEDTVIGNGVKIDNLVQIAHNVHIGDGTAIAGCVGIAGSAVIGKNCQLGGSAGILGHLEICDNVIISSMSLVTRSIKKPGFYSGVFPLQENADWERVAASLKQLPSIRQRLRELERLTHD